LPNLLSPILVAIIGTGIGLYFNWSIEQEKQKLQQVDLEVRKMDVAQKMLIELFSETPDRAIIAHLLMSKVIDKDFSDRVCVIMWERFRRMLAEKLEGQQLAQAGAVASAAELLGRSCENVRTELKKPYYIVSDSIKPDKKEEAISRAQYLEKQDYQSEVHYSASGWYVVTIGHLPLAQAVSLRRQAIEKGHIASDSYLLVGKKFTDKIFPQ